MRCRACGKEIGADSSIGMDGRIMCFSCGTRALKDAGIDVGWLGVENRLRHRRRRSHPRQTSLVLWSGMESYGVPT